MEGVLQIKTITKNNATTKIICLLNIMILYYFVFIKIYLLLFIVTIQPIAYRDNLT